ncbi:MAG: hypothetical protein C0394_02555 [Syntrophus sp. (in: bacteria)]|nr:hypothetical protein [Syntrophus sp. (in: bacteria)]
MPSKGEGEGGFQIMIRLLAAAAVIVLLILTAHYFNAQALLIRALDWISDLGAWGVLVFIILYILACVFFLPGSILTLGAGIIFGLFEGSVIVSISSTLGATAAFIVGRYFARDWVAKKIEGNPGFKTIDDAVAKEGWKIVGLTRLSPVFPFNLLNYAYGLTKVSLRDYFFASWIGMLPGTIMYVYIGSLVGDLARLSAGGRTRTTAEWALYVVGFMATVMVTIYVTRIARAALSKKEQPESIIRLE